MLRNEHDMPVYLWAAMIAVEQGIAEAVEDAYHELLLYWWNESLHDGE